MKTEKELEEKGFWASFQELKIAVYLVNEPKEKALMELYRDYGNPEGEDLIRYFKMLVALLEFHKDELPFEGQGFCDKARELLDSFGDYLKEVVTNTEPLKVEAEYAYDYEYDKNDKCHYVEFDAERLENVIKGKEL